MISGDHHLIELHTTTKISWCTVGINRMTKPCTVSNDARYLLLHTGKNTTGNVIHGFPIATGLLYVKFAPAVLVNITNLALTNAINLYSIGSTGYVRVRDTDRT